MALMMVWTMGLVFGGIVGMATGVGAGVGVAFCANAVGAPTVNRTAAKIPTNRDFIPHERTPYADGSRVIRLASTVMLLRSTARQPLEVFMLRRSAKSAFAPDVFVFPGGTVDESDYAGDALLRVSGASAQRLAGIFRAERAPGLEDAEGGAIQEADRRALVSAALRELFEEAGVLLGADGCADAGPERLHAAREGVFSGKLRFSQALADLGTHLDAGGLELFSQWITPPGEGRRFNAHFFIARGDAQHAIADRVETHDEIWIAPKVALERFEAGSYAMVYPTIKHIERLARFDSVDELLEFARSKPILRIMPHMSAADGFTLPPDLEHAW